MDKSDFLAPWMLRADWREDMRPYVLVDLAAWPDDLAIAPLPPVPVIGLGPSDHPLAKRMDLIPNQDISLDAVIEPIRETPQASAAIVQLLRVTEGLEVDDALTAESFAYAMLQAGNEHARWMAQRRPSQFPAPSGGVVISRHGHVLEMRIARPWARNAIDHVVRDELFDGFMFAATDTSISRVRLSGEGRCFSMGADLDEFGTTRDPAIAHTIRSRTLPARAIIRCSGIVEVDIQGGCVGSDWN